MTFSEKTAGRIRSTLKHTRGLTERPMFGGAAFMLDGHMCCGVIEDKLVVRVGPNDYQQALQEPHARPMDFTGRPLAGFVYVAREGYESDQALLRWIHRGLDFVSTLPPR
jgi:TfoX/Sxy family transcriptional regulator of competence genes